MKTHEVVFVGLSGGVDSSVAALRLKKAGHTVVGVFIKVWQPDFLNCNWEAERLDAMRVAARLDIPFVTFDAEDVYKREVADYMIQEYQEGRTPNPDVMCNQHVKFGAFLEFARAEGADRVATGHYARIQHERGNHRILRGVDTRKDQSYFLWTLTEAQRKDIYFPVGDTPKETIRKEAARAGLITSSKPDSQGVCFLGQIDMKEFLGHYVQVEEGAVLNEGGTVIGAHDGALFYTYGQRHGFRIHTEGAASTPNYVIQKDLAQNTLTVSSKPRALENAAILLTHTNFMETIESKYLYAQFRYRQKPFKVQLERRADDTAFVTPHEKVERPSSGQSCVLYDGDICVGGGIISE